MFTWGPSSGGGLAGCLYSDAYFSSVRLLPRGQGSGTTFTDSSPVANAQTGYVNAVIDSAQALECFGPTSIKLTAGYVTYPTSVGVMASAAFTVEAWIYKTSASAMGIMALRASIARGWALQTDSFRAMIDGVWSDAQLVPGSTPSANVWTHIAVTHDGAGLYTYWKDGVAEDSNTFGTGTLDDVGSSAFLVGASSDSGEAPFTGHLYVRVTPGVCRYTSTFTPPNNFPAG